MNKRIITRGVLYFAQGKRFIDEAIFSARTFRRHHKNVPIVLITPDNIRKPSQFDDIIIIPDLGNPFKTKVSSLTRSPFDHTLFLDSDTIIKESVYELFDFLLNYDLVIANRVLCEWNEAYTRFIDYVDPDCYNTGVFAFSKSPIMTAFINEWIKRVLEEDSSRMRSGYFCDQHHFNELLFKDQFGKKIGLKLVEVPNKKYNARPHLLPQLKIDKEFDEIKILHHHFETNPIKRLRGFAGRIKARVLGKNSY
ncbi:hypothetical protein [Flavihumibacter sp. ZG627]|uniref:hypothetical protein n=1 Tax=Flavihumibacter sp. ZG627 TaxID=1463156 RepID=UPI00057F1552|nr:hypothetical protein [Flavihumibacter sp. ZG627]KIC92278.1 hypothetical protein HY58_01635 [Flavihumibacter sp. ZG627]